MLSGIASHLDAIFLTRVPPYDRCAEGEDLMRAAGVTNASCFYEEEISGALDSAIAYARRKSLPLVVFGSIYLTGSILNLLQRQKSLEST